MNKIVLNYILKNYFKYFFIVVLTIYGFGIILNLFEEIEFFKKTNVSFFYPLMLTSLFVPSTILNLLPFIIFISSMLYMIKIRNNKDLLTLKINGFSSIKIFFIFAITSFFLGWLVLMLINPVTSSMLQFYEKTKSKYARDIDHLVSFNKNGLWIRENIDKGSRIITAKKPEDTSLIEIKIFQFDDNFLLTKKIFSSKAEISNFDWILTNGTVYELSNSIFESKKFNTYNINSNYNYEKIINLFNNSNTLSFINLVFNYDDLIKKGYDDEFLTESLHSMLVFPFFLFLMTAIASILTMHTLKKSENLKFIFVGLIVCIMVYYLKDLFLALGKTGRIPIILSIWSPIITLGFFTLVGILQINEK
jgi:lipopolysaccharide export system permease protein